MIATIALTAAVVVACSAALARLRASDRAVLASVVARLDAEIGDAAWLRRFCLALTTDPDPALLDDDVDAS